MSWFYSKSGSGFDADAQAYFDRINANSGTIDLTAQTAINDFVLGCKADSIWSLLLDVVPLCGDRPADGFTKLVTAVPGEYFAEGVGMAGGEYAQSTGLTLNGTSEYLRSNVVANTLTTNSTGLAVYSRLTVNGTTMIHGADGGAGARIFMYAPFGGDNKVYARHYTNEIGSAALSGAIGLLHTTNDGGTHTVYRNGSSIVSASDGGAPPSREIYYGAFNNVGTPAYGGSEQTLAFLAITAGMDSTEAAALYSRVQALQTALGRNV